MHGFLVFEDFTKSPHRTFLRAFGVDWSTTPLGWLTVPAFASLGLLVGLLRPGAPLPARLTNGLAGGLVVLASQLLHELGHVLTARLVGGPMREVRFAAIRPLTLYHDAVEPPRRVHLGRALGGPAANLAVGLALLPSRGAFLPAFAAWLNLAFGLISLLPIPSVDGEVIWRSLRA